MGKARKSRKNGTYMYTSIMGILIICKWLQMRHVNKMICVPSIFTEASLSLN